MTATYFYDSGPGGGGARNNRYAYSISFMLTFSGHSQELNSILRAIRASAPVRSIIEDYSKQSQYSPGCTKSSPQVYDKNVIGQIEGGGGLGEEERNFGKWHFFSGLDFLQFS